MKNVFIHTTICLLLTVQVTFSQNLVPNPSFETNDGTLTSCASTNDVLNWGGNSNGTTDYHHENYNWGSATCDLYPWPTAGFCSAPYPHGPSCGGWDGSTGYAGGQACMGVSVSKFDAYREYAIATLTTAMDVTKTYDISFAIRTPYNPTNNLAHCVSHMGMVMTDWDASGFNWNSVANGTWWPQGGAVDWVYIPTAVTDEDWTEYSWTYTPNYPNTQIHVGPTLDWPAVTWADWDGSGGLSAYYHIDDVVVQEVVPLAEDELEIVAEVLSRKEIKVEWRPTYIDFEATYELLKSEDGGISFIKIQSIRGDGLADFVTIDDNPLTEDIYYKVRKIEGDQRRISDPVKVSNPFITDGIEWNVKSTNEGQLLVDFRAKNIGQSTFVIYDINGRKLLDQNISLSEGSNTLQFDVSGLITGVYLCAVNGNSHKKIIIK